MIRLITLGFLATFLPFAAQACDQCGCSASLSGMGALPRLRNPFVGVRWERSAYTITEHTLMTESGKLITHDVYNRFDLWGRVYVHPRVQLVASIPYRQILRTTNNGTLHELRGAGDATISANWIALDRKAALRHVLVVGGGVSLPTGKYLLGGVDQAVRLPGLQPGTGAFGFTLQSAYTLRWKKLGTSVDLQARFNTTSSIGYRQGHRADGTLRLFYWIEHRKLNLLPTVALVGGWGGTDLFEGRLLAGSGGGMLGIMPGLEAYYGNFSLSIFYKQPIASNKGNGTIAPEGTWAVSVIYLFNSSTN